MSTATPPRPRLLDRLRFFGTMDPVQKVLVLFSGPLMLLVYLEFQRRFELFQLYQLSQGPQGGLQGVAHELLLEWFCVVDLAYLLLLLVFQLRGCDFLRQLGATARQFIWMFYGAGLLVCGYALVNHVLWAGGQVRKEWAFAPAEHVLVGGWIVLSCLLWSLDSRAQSLWPSGGGRPSPRQQGSQPAQRAGRAEDTHNKHFPQEAVHAS